MKPQEMSRFDEEFGKAVADRLGLPHSNTLQEWSAERLGKTMLVTMTVMKAVPLDEFSELKAAARVRASA